MTPTSHSTTWEGSLRHIGLVPQNVNVAFLSSVGKVRYMGGSSVYERFPFTTIDRSRRPCTKDLRIVRPVPHFVVFQKVTSVFLSGRLVLVLLLDQGIVALA